MGSFDVACSLTGTPIMCGDACVFVVLKKDFEPLFHVQWDAKYDVERIIKSTYDDYGRPAPVKGATREYIESITDHEHGRFFFFICQTAWDWCLKTYKVSEKAADPDASTRKLYTKLAKLIKERSIKTEKLPLALLKKPEPWLREMTSVLWAFQSSCRNPLAGYWATGQWYTETLPAVESLLALTQRRVAEIKKDHPWMEKGYEEPA